MITKITVTENKLDHNKIGATFIYLYQGVEHVLLRVNNHYISLTDPNKVWSMTIDDKSIVRFVDLEIKVID